MNNVTIQVAQVQPPAPGKKRGKVIDTSNIAYQAGYPLLGSFQPGQSYNITYKDDSFNGFAFRVIEQATPASGQMQMAVGQPAVPTQPAPQAFQRAPQGRQYGRQTDEDLPERIFVCGALNAALSNTNTIPINLTEAQLTAIVNNLRRVYKRTFGGQPTAGDDMNDEIPFETEPTQQAAGGFN